MQHEKGCMMEDKPKMANPQVAFSVPASLLEKTDKLAEREMISRAAFLRRLLAERVRLAEGV